MGTKTDVENPYDAKQQLKEIIQKIDSLYVGVSTLNSQQQVTCAFQSCFVCVFRVSVGHILFEVFRVLVIKTRVRIVLIHRRCH